MQKFFNEFFNLQVIGDMLPGLFTEAAKNTIIFTTLGFSGGLSFGLLLALMRISPRKRWRWPSAVVIDTFRGLPLLLTIIFIGYGIPIALQGFEYPFPNYLPGALALSIVGGAYMAETIRAGIEAVPKGQMEAARSLGMSHRLAMRKVVLPQAFRIIIPPLTNELVLLFKDTSLLSVLGVLEGGKELTKYARDFMNQEANTSPLVAAGIVYLIITLPLIQLVRYMENRAKATRA